MKSTNYRKLKKILLATLATTTIFHGTVYAAQSVQPSGTSDNSVEVNEESYSVNGETTAVEDDYDIVYGGGNEQNSAEAADNSVTINGGNLNGAFGGMSTTGSVRGNTVTINGGNFRGGVAGGVAFFPYDGSTSAGNVFDNSVIVNGGTIDFVSGGEVSYSYPVDGSAPDFSQFQIGGNVYNNAVQIYGGNITGGINGGAALTGSANNNTVDIRGGTISGNVIGGEVREPGDSSSVTGNVINIYGNPDLSRASLFGGKLGSSYVAADNTLNINTAGITVKNINFDSFGAVNFNIPDNIASGGNIMTIADGTSGVDLSKIGIGVSSNSILDVEDTINLIVNGNSASYNESMGDAIVSKGVTLLYDAHLVSDMNGVTATIYGVRTSDNPTEKANSGDFPELQTNIPDPFSDIVADVALESDESSDDTSGDTENINVGVFVTGGYNAFLNTGGGRIKTKAGGGSHITTKSTNYDLGFSRVMGSQEAGHLYLAPVIEYVHSTYDSSFANGMRGAGSTKYTAGGIMARQSSRNGMYYEGSLRGGRLKNEFSSSDFIFNGEKINVGYNMSAPIFSGHVRIGNVNRMNRNNVLDVYGIYAYARQNGMSTDLSTGDHVDFSSIDSNTIRLGYRMTTRASRISKVYTGLAYQYDTTSSSTVTSQRYPKTSEGAKGSSGILELGWQIRPLRDNPWALDIKAVGWAGFHQGFNVLANMQKSF